MANNSEVEVLIERKGAALWITLNKPQTMNAMTQPMLQELKRSLRDVAGDSTLRVVVLTGKGRGFCVGADLADFAQRSKTGEMKGFRHELDSNFHPVINAMRSLGKIVITRINGTCAGAGLAFAMAGDIRYALKATGFVAAFIKVGLVPDSGLSYTIAKALGYCKALEFFLSQGKATAEDFAAAGLINKVFESSEAMDQALNSLIGYLAELPPLALTLTKKILRAAASQSLSFEDALNLEAATQEFLGNTKDHAEGLAAFLDKRKPVFTGQ